MTQAEDRRRAALIRAQAPPPVALSTFATTLSGSAVAVAGPGSAEGAVPAASRRGGVGAARRGARGRRGLGGRSSRGHGGPVPEALEEAGDDAMLALFPEPKRLRAHRPHAIASTVPRVSAAPAAFPTLSLFDPVSSDDEAPRAATLAAATAVGHRTASESGAGTVAPGRPVVSSLPSARGLADVGISSTFSPQLQPGAAATLSQGPERQPDLVAPASTRGPRLSQALEDSLFHSDGE